jgi:selT/selW/selH-like putative selenoprotein
LAAELEEELGVRARLVKGGRGVFDVVVDGKLVFSKYEAGRFPAVGELSKLLRGPA